MCEPLEEIVRIPRCKNVFDREEGDTWPGAGCVAEKFGWGYFSGVHALHSDALTGEVSSVLGL